MTIAHLLLVSVGMPAVVLAVGLGGALLHMRYLRREERKEAEAAK